MKYSILALSLILVMTMVGCSDKGDTASGQLLTRNMQFATLNSTGQVAAVVILDRLPIENVDAAKVELVGCLNDMKTVVGGTVTVGNLKAELNKVVPVKYQALVSQALVFVEGVSVPTEKLGANNVLRVTEFLNGALWRSEAYDKSVRNKALSQPVTSLEVKLVKEFAEPVPQVTTPAPAKK